MGFLAKLGLVEEKPEPKDADLSDDDMDKIIAEGKPEAKGPKVKPLTMSTGPAADPVIGSTSPAPQQHPMEFPAIYSAGKVPTPDHGFTVLKVSAMLQAGRLGKMDPKIRGAVVLATLEANSVPVGDVFADAEARAACLEGYQQFLEKKLLSGDDANKQEIARLEAELAEVTASVRAKIEVLNRERLQRDTMYRVWLGRKAAELDLINGTVKTLQDSDKVGESFDGDPMFNSNPFLK